MAVCGFAAGGALCVSWSGAADLPVMIPAGCWKLEEDAGRRGRGVVAESRGKLEDDERPAVSDWSDQLPPTAQRHGGKPDGNKKKDLWIWENMCPVWGSPSWRWDEGRIDWRWWTVNEGIDFRVRVAGWGLEINWNKDINTSSVLPPEHTRALSQIYYDTC